MESIKQPHQEVVQGDLFEQKPPIEAAGNNTPTLSEEEYADLYKNDEPYHKGQR